ncbi:Nuclear pore complex protein Nup214 [Habropoda laboriosa]|uniref:Nuclear pore complex protein Nup214 n=1 Tax=Habropoda laboriosa TaxID=597456 RepID=A0A0L7R5C0_9HYME|nr:Nuclear pore complex protein Nup214 [Habropoda laboriosa]
MKTAPDPKDVQEFQFKQSKTCQILDAFTSIPTACSLLAADRKRGLLFAGQNNKIIILKPGEDADPEWKVEFNISVAVSKLMLSCDCSYLAVASHGPVILIYDVQSIIKNNLQLLYKIKISSSSSDAFVNDLRWNPAIPGMLCTVVNDYTIGSFKIKEKKEKAIELMALQKFNHFDALCAAWSPKGKQIVVGCKNGKLVQFKPDLKLARIIPGPNPYIGEVVSILWISNYQFCAAYLSSEQLMKKINVLIVDAPKGETLALFTCYEDITYGMTDTEGEGTTPCYYFDHVPEWGLIIAASSNSSEIAVLGTTDAGVTWNQWQLVDSGRAELPLICTTESYPVGLAIDKSPVRRLLWGADSTLPHPVPILHILATSGQLCSFHMVNLVPNCPPINCPPTEIVTPPQTQPNVAPEISFVMNGLATSTPVPKQAENVTERAKPFFAGNIFDKVTPEVTNLFAQPTVKKPKQQEQKLESINMVMKLEPAREFHPEETVKPVPVVNLTPIKETIQQEPVEQKPSPDDDARDIRAYLEEYNLFEKELRNRLEPQIWECGTEEERRKLVDTSVIIDQFLRELRETTNSLSSDITYLKALLLQSFAWVEETKSKNAATNDITTRNCGDSNKISDLQKLYYYTQTQLNQASKILDLEWSDHKNQEMSRMKIPHLEFIYQNIVLHSKILQEEKGKVEDLSKRWKLINRNSTIFGLNLSLSNLRIASSKSSATLPRNAGIIEARCKTIASKTLSFTPEKQIKLRKYLSACTPRIIKPVNPSPIQHRLEATLSSLTSLNSTSNDTKSKVERPVLKQSPVTKQQTTEKPKQQSPLASLNSIVARIGTNETNNVSQQNKQTSFGITFPPTSGSKPVQTEKESITPAITAASQSKPKQDTITFGQVNPPTHNLLNLMKSFPKVDSITFGTPAQKSEETTTQKSVLNESTMKSGKDTISNADGFKVENSLFGTSLLKDALSSETSSEKVQTITPNTGLKFGMAIPATTMAKTDAMSTFSFASPNTVPATINSTLQSTLVASQTSSAQTFSFASKPSSTTTPFNLKVTPSTTAASQSQDLLNVTGLFTGLQTSNQAPNIPTNISSFQTLLGQNVLGGNEISISLVSGTLSKDTVTTSAVATTPSITIEKVPSTEVNVLGPSTGSVQALPAASTTAPSTTAPLFGSQTNTSNINIFGGMSNSIPTTTASVTSTAASPIIATSTTVSPFQSPLAKPTFGVPVINVPTVSSTNAVPTTTSTPTFGNAPTNTVAVTQAAPVAETQSFLALTTNSQFLNSPAVSSTANAFEKPVTSPTFTPFGNSTNTSIFGQIFSENNVNSIFGGNTQSSSTTSIFGGSTALTNTFGTTQKSMFDTENTSSFGGAANNATSGLPPPESTSPFGVAAPNASPMGVEQPVLGAQPAFRQAPSFNTKPVFGSTPTFGAPKPIFGGGFGATAFGVSATPPAFGSPRTMESPVQIDNNMPNVFGSVSGSSTFESLASQSTDLSFSSLAQKSVDTPKSPVFTTSVKIT